MRSYIVSPALRITHVRYAGETPAVPDLGVPVQSVDLVIADIAWLITMDPGRRVIRDAAVAVDGGKIIAVGKSADVAAHFAGKSTVDGRGIVATPGFVDCHL